MPDEVSFYIELIKTAANVVTAGAATYGVHAGLSKWRAETIGKRKAELAEEVLADFFEARDIIRTSREVGGFGGEASTQQRASDEPNNESRDRDAVSKVSERLETKQEFFARLEARRYRFIALFGAQAGGPYDELFEIRKTISIATHMLMSPHLQSDANEWLDILFARTSDDPIKERLDRVVEVIEMICRPSIQEAAK